MWENVQEIPREQASITDYGNQFQRSIASCILHMLFFSVDLFINDVLQVYNVQISKYKHEL